MRLEFDELLDNAPVTRKGLVDKNGNPTQASGVIAFPRSDWPNEKNQAYPILSYQHGTVIEKDAVTSQTGIWILPALIAGYGYVYLEPDYLGLGISDGLHPYQIKEPYGTHVVDFIRAADQFSNINNDFQINSQVFLAGYSEGGYATMASVKEIEENLSDEFNITAKEIFIDKDNKIVEGDPNKIQTVIDQWKFTRKISSPSPNWYLAEIKNS